MGELRLQGISANSIAKIGIELIARGKVRDHKLSNTSQIHTGEMERKECQTYRDFLPSKNCCMIYELTGSDLYD